MSLFMKFPPFLGRLRSTRLLGPLLLTFLAGCGPGPATTPKVSSSPDVVLALERFSKESIGQPFEGKPWISHVNVVALDRDGRADILACDDKLNGVVWLRQAEPGKFTESTLMAGLPSPVHVEAVDLD